MSVAQLLISDRKGKGKIDNYFHQYFEMYSPIPGAGPGMCKFTHRHLMNITQTSKVHDMSNELRYILFKCACPTNL